MLIYRESVPGSIITRPRPVSHCGTTQFRRYGDLAKSARQARDCVFIYEGEPVKKAGGHAWRKALVRAGIEDFRDLHGNKHGHFLDSRGVTTDVAPFHSSGTCVILAQPFRE